ncbi:MAG: aminoglycoside phosphotransferase family protein [Candidatus Dormibacteraeota bacterium]|nr:aminoglycoside phosphotransferase family protein [Candidatus Dormibacteraeota bacterium]
MSARLGRAVSVVIAGRESLGTSSHPIHRLHVTLDSGERLPVIYKRLHRGLKQYGSEREVLVYRKLPAGQRFDAPELYASLYDRAHGRYWLFLEDVGDCDLENGDADDWLAAVSRLAEMHAAYLGREGELRALGCLEEQGAGYYRRIARTARRTLRLARSATALAHFDSLMWPFASVVAYLTSRPRTLVHGDIFPKNLMVQPGSRIRPVDWESAGIGPAAWDLARLVDGWGADKQGLIEAYLEAVSRCEAAPFDRGEFVRTFGRCEIVNALRHLGWSVKDCRDAPAVEGLLNSMETFFGCLDDPERILAALGRESRPALHAGYRG